MTRRYSTTAIVLTGAIFIIIASGILLLIFSKQDPLTCEELGLPVTCSEDSDCGISAFYGNTYCKDDNLWQAYYQNTCIGTPGTCESYCTSAQTERMVQTCNNGCSQGRCLD